MSEALRTIEQVNEKIAKGDVVVLTAEEFVKIAESSGLEKAAREVDVVTTGTFGAMCSSGAFLNFGHADPPIKMTRAWLNDVPVYKGLAAVDGYIGAAAYSETRGIEYGGGHVIEDLVSGKELILRGESYGTDCYPRKYVETIIRIDDLNQAVLVNPRNAYQRYFGATNSSDRTLYTYLGTLLPNYGNVGYSGSGELSPLYKDKDLETIGIGTRIFLGGGIGYVIGEGTQHYPSKNLSTIMVAGDLKQMNPRFLKGATFYKYGATLYVGLGIPIPLINMNVARNAATPDREIFTEIMDYSVPSVKRPVVKKVSYEELKSGRVEINGKTVKAASMSSLRMAREVAQTLKKWIEEGLFLLTKPVAPLRKDSVQKTMPLRKHEPKVVELMRTQIVTAKITDSIKDVSTKMVRGNADHVPVVDENNKLVGIVTTWDIAKAVALNVQKLDAIMTRNVIVAKPYETIDIVAKRMEQYDITGLPVVDDEGHVLGLITSADLSRLFKPPEGGVVIEGQA
ncbi:MAG: homocysteine biosynthesis protein [Candidatus Brockarchaeota archaeon]|nr:homocysteine biosynthesis protein [Candidatus Brockarchaeota archaeon]